MSHNYLWYVSCILIKPVLPLQFVSGCYLWHCFKLTDHACLWLAGGKPSAPQHYSHLLSKPALAFAVCEWLLLVTLFQAHRSCLLMALQMVSLLLLSTILSCWPSLFMALQNVSHYCVYPYDDLSLANWVYIYSSESTFLCLWHCCKPANQAHSWLCRQLVAVISDNISRLLINTILNSVVGELLLFCAPWQACWPSLLGL